MEYELVVASSAIYNRDTLDMADLYPDTHFLVAGGFLPSAADRVIITEPRLYMTRYISGALCASVTKSNKIGFMASYYGSLARSYNAFYLGAKSVNSDVEVYIANVNSWLDPITMQAATKRVIEDYDVDCLDSHHSDFTMNEVAATYEGVYHIGYSGETRFFVGSSCLTSCVYNWGTEYYNIINELLDDNLTAFNRHPGYFEDGVSLSSFSERMTPQMVELVESQEQRFRNGEKVYCGSEAAEFGTLQSDGCLSDSDIYKIFTPINGAIVPSDLNLTLDDVLISVYLESGSSYAIFMTVVVVLVYLSTVGIMIHSVKYRSYPTYKHSSPVFCGLILLGVLCLCTSILLDSGEPTNLKCSLRLWMLGIGFVLCFVPLLAKNYRIARLMDMTSMKIFKIKDSDVLLKYILPPLLVMILILSLWHYLDPLIVVYSSSVSLQMDEQYKYCYSEKGSLVFPIIAIAYLGLMLLPGVFISYNTKSIKRQELKESRGIALTIYNTTFVTIISVGLAFLIDYSPLKMYMIVNLSIWWVCICVLVTIFVPKMIYLSKNDSKDLTTSPGTLRRVPRGSKSTTNSGSVSKQKIRVRNSTITGDITDDSSSSTSSISSLLSL
eukprot:TRINITY_DN2196_c0_g2_i1.p1 TRINITY_DN2196_c0_g2~~TRINITY_DN2196_c0_g2_i1.p1  ORF type:complete len:663 (-),score=114.13 TRINITY_DN2196_c0_g2_i1:345-2174(-)